VCEKCEKEVKILFPFKTKALISRHVTSPMNKALRHMYVSGMVIDSRETDRMTPPVLVRDPSAKVCTKEKINLSDVAFKSPQNQKATVERHASEPMSKALKHTYTYGLDFDTKETDRLTPPVIIREKSDKVHLT
jgi:hypothetical protein